MVGTATRDMVPLKSALGENFRPGIPADCFSPVSSLKKQAPPTTMTIDAHSGDNVIADINPATGVAVRSYVTPTLDGNVSMTDISGSTYYYNSDERQSVKNLTDSSAAVVQSYDYSAYGDKLDSLTSGSVSQRYTYTGRELNDASNNYYFRYRMYGAGVGGFLSRDPLGYVTFAEIEYEPLGYFIGMNLYSGYFARSMIYTDPMGRENAISTAISDWWKGQLVDGVVADAAEGYLNFYKDWGDSMVDGYNASIALAYTGDITKSDKEVGEILISDDVQDTASCYMKCVASMNKSVGMHLKNLLGGATGGVLGGSLHNIPKLWNMQLLPKFPIGQSIGPGDSYFTSRLRLLQRIARNTGDSRALSRYRRVANAFKRPGGIPSKNPAISHGTRTLSRGAAGNAARGAIAAVAILETYIAIRCSTECNEDPYYDCNK